MAEIEWAPVGVDVTTPNVARMYDYLLGGENHFPADRAAAERIVEVVPGIPAAVRGNRAFLTRAVRHLAESGIRQFVDIGTGLPTRSNAHEVALGVAPDARVVCVDNDPVVLAHARALLAGLDQVAVVEGDLRRPEEILQDAAGRLIDFSRPVAILLVDILHLIPDDDDPGGIVRQLREAMAPGSYLVVAHGTAVDGRRDGPPRVMSVYDGSNGPVVLRDHGEVLRFFDGLDLVDPGLVHTVEWRPDAAVSPVGPAKSHVFGGVARKG